MERFFRSLKTEWIGKRRYPEVQAAITDITEYVSHYYNYRRPHSANDYMTPAAFEAKAAA